MDRPLRERRGDAGATGTSASVKNKLPAPVQVTAEQLLREATERLAGDLGKRKYYLDEGLQVDDYRQRERARFEDAIRRSRSSIPIYLRYAKWEEERCGDLARARSIYERALAQDPRSPRLWLRYAESEMRAGNVNLARNVWDRAVTILPRTDAFWFKRIQMEQVINDIPAARAVWERWMRWEPEEQVWRSYVRFECVLKEWGRARMIYERMLVLYSDRSLVWQAYASFEETEATDCMVTDTDDDLEKTMKESLKTLRFRRTRAVWERSLSYISTTSPSHLVEFAKFETRVGEMERARAIYRYAMQRFPDAEPLRYSYVAFEKQSGDPELVQTVVLERRRRQYEKRVQEVPFDYDGWFDLIRLEEGLFLSLSSETESSQQLERVRDAYERAIAQIPAIKEKRHWRRYIYLWLFYAAFEELHAGDPRRAIQILKTCIKDVVPHSSFTFAKLWYSLSDVYVRLDDLRNARLTLGEAIGRCPKPRIFKSYLDLEQDLREFDRCRTIFTRQLDWMPSASSTWIRFAELERALGEEERARALYELAINEDSLDVPEAVWKAYIDWEFEEGHFDAARSLYERLLEKSQHVKVWISFASMELMIDSSDGAIQDKASRVRKVMERALRTIGLADEDKLVLLEAWRELEILQDNSDYADRLTRTRFPRTVLAADQNGREREVLEWPELVDGDGNAERLLQLAKKWKQTSD